MLISKTNLIFSGACAIACTFENTTFLVICQPPSSFATKPTPSCDFSVSYIFPWWLFLFPSEIFPSQCHEMDPPVWKKKKLFFWSMLHQHSRCVFSSVEAPRGVTCFISPWMETPSSVSPAWVWSLSWEMYLEDTEEHFFKCYSITLKTRRPLHNSCWCLQIQLLAQLLWFNPSWKLSTTNLPAHTSPTLPLWWDGEGNQGKEI